MALDARGHRVHDDLRGSVLTDARDDVAQGRPSPAARLLYLDWLRGVAVLAMVHAHLIDSWTRDADRHSQIYYSLQWVGGIASALFLFLAGVALAMSGETKARQSGSLAAAARAVRHRGWEVFLLAFVFRLQAQIFGWGPLQNLLKVDMLNIMGLSMVVASVMWQLQPRRSWRLAAFAALTAIVTMMTPLVRATPWLAVLPDPIEGYLRPAGAYSAFALFPWAGYLFGGVLVGELVDATRVGRVKPSWLQTALAVAGALGVTLGWLASFRPALFPTASFWHDSPTLFFMRLGVLTAVVPAAWTVEKLSAYSRHLTRTVLQPLVTLGRSSLFVYWIHVEMVYGVIAEPIKKQLPLWGSELGWALLCVALYQIVRWKNRLMEGYELPRRARIFAAVLR